LLSIVFSSADQCELPPPDHHFQELHHPLYHEFFSTHFAYNTKSLSTGLDESNFCVNHLSIYHHSNVLELFGKVGCFVNLLHATTFNSSNISLHDINVIENTSGACNEISTKHLTGIATPFHQ
jgi:hypothetical protein